MTQDNLFAYYFTRAKKKILFYWINFENPPVSHREPNWPFRSDTLDLLSIEHLGYIMISSLSQQVMTAQLWRCVSYFVNWRWLKVSSTQPCIIIHSANYIICTLERPGVTDQSCIWLHFQAKVQSSLWHRALRKSIPENLNWESPPSIIMNKSLIPSKSRTNMSKVLRTTTSPFVYDIGTCRGRGGLLCLMMEPTNIDVAKLQGWWW